MIIFTSICANYVHKARVLAKSVKKNIPDAKMILCLVERDIDERIFDEYFDDIILAKDAWEGNFNRFIFKHSIVEASTSVKGQFLRYLMDKYIDEENFVYLDPDVCVYSDFVELRALLKEYPIVLCPHLLTYGNIDMELSSTAHGVYNLGFLAVNRSEESRKCVDWWADRLYLYCYDDIKRVIFTDQKWFDLAPCFFNVKILKHHGYDFAPWSLLNCTITKNDNNEYYINGDPLRFIHFSGFGESINNCIEKWLPESGELFKELYAGYVKEHNENNLDNISKTEWSYLKYTSGEKIDLIIRKAYRERYDVMFLNDDPFNYSNREYYRILAIDKKGAPKKYSQIMSKINRAKEIYNKDGFIVLLKSFVRRLRK